MTRKLLFVATEDWFVRSHFLPLIERSREEGFEPIVAARMGDARAALEAAGARTIDIAASRGANDAGTLWRASQNVRRILQNERPALVHAIALRAIGLVSLAALGAPKAPHVLALTGLGYHGAAGSWSARAKLAAASTLIGARARAGDAVLLVENDADAAWAGAAESAVRIPGAGVDLSAYQVVAEPPSPPLRIGLVARLIWSKGADIAVEALRRVRAQGIDAVLSIAGAPDPENPAAVPAEELAVWAHEPGVEMLGHVTDINAFWAAQHIACLPSRGGEGLPRSLLEAGACGRPIVTTTVPGCQDFVVDGEGGFVVAPDDPGALAAAIRRLTDTSLRSRLGQGARARVANGYTTRHATDAAAKAWRRALGG